MACHLYKHKIMCIHTLHASWDWQSNSNRHGRTHTYLRTTKKWKKIRQMLHANPAWWKQTGCMSMRCSWQQQRQELFGGAQGVGNNAQLERWHWCVSESHLSLHGHVRQCVCVCVCLWQTHTHIYQVYNKYICVCDFIYLTSFLFVFFLDLKPR